MNCHRIYGLLFAAGVLPIVSVVDAQAPTADKYVDPAGRYTLSIPPGWTVQKGFYGYTFRMASAELRPTTSRQTDIGEAMLDFASETGRGWKEVRRGEGKIVGQRSLYQVWSGMTAEGVRAVKRMTVVKAGGQVYAFLTTAEEKDWPAVGPSAEAIEQSFQLQGGVAAARSGSPASPAGGTPARTDSRPAPVGRTPVRTDSPPATVETSRDLWDTLIGERRESASARDLKDDLALGPAGTSPPPVPPRPPVPARTPATSPPPATPPGGASTFSDSKGRFRIGVPRGWTANEGGGGATIWRGEMYVTVVPLDGPPAPGLLATFSQQVSKQWQNFRQIEAGPWTLGGMPGEFGMYAGTNPRGVLALLRIVTAGAAGGGLILMMSVPQSEWESSKAELKQMEESISTGAGAASRGGPVAAGSPGSRSRPEPAPTPVTPPAVGRQALTRPSQALRNYQGRGFEVSIPSNWTAEVSSSGMATYLSAPDGRVKREGNVMTTYLGMIVGFNAVSITDLTRLADQEVRNLQGLNPGLRILTRQPMRVSGLNAESVLMEEPADDGVMERTWLVITPLGDRALYITLTSPLEDYDGLRGLFGQIVASVRLRAM
jgi:hypothetical protein